MSNTSSANFNSSDMNNNILTVLPEVIKKNRERLLTELSYINSSEKATHFKRIAFVIRSECLQTLQEKSNTPKDKKKKKSCFNIFRRKNKNYTLKNNFDAMKFADNINVFDIVTVLCLQNVSDLPTVYDIESFVDESLKLILHRCNVEVSRILRNCYSCDNQTEEQESEIHSPIMWLRRDSSRDRYLVKLDPEYSSLRQMNGNQEQHSEYSSAYIFDQNCDWRSIYTVEQLSRKDSEQSAGSTSEDVVTTYIEKSKEEKNKLREKLEKIIHKNVKPLEEAHEKMSSLCQFIQDMDYGLDNHTNTLNEYVEQQHNMDENNINTNHFDHIAVIEHQNLDQHDDGYIEEINLKDNESENNKKAEQIIYGKNFRIHTRQSTESNDSSSANNIHQNNFNNETDQIQSDDTILKNTRFQPCKSEDTSQSETKTSQNSQVKNNTNKIRPKYAQNNNKQNVISGQSSVSNSPQNQGTKFSPEKIHDKKKHYKDTLEKAKALQDERQQKLLEHIKLKQQREEERRSKLSSEYEQKILQRQQEAKEKKFSLSHNQYQQHLHHVQRNGFVE